MKTTLRALALLLAISVPLEALAQPYDDEAASPETADAVERPASPEAPPAMPLSPWDESPAAKRAVRFAGVLLGAGVGTVVGLVPGALVFFAGVAAMPGLGGVMGALVISGSLGLACGFLGMAGGAALMGHWLDGNGGFWAPLGGGALGMLAAVILGVANPALWWTALVLPVVGAATFYELASDVSRTRVEAPAAVSTARRPRLEPRVSIRPDGKGAALALRGTF
jgi:hypothetical protein